MANLCVRNGLNGSKESKKENSSYKATNTKGETERHLPPLNTKSEESNGRIVTIFSLPTRLGDLDKYQTEFSPVLQPFQQRYQPEKYMLLLRDEVREIQQLTASLGIQRQLEIADKANKLELKAAERLEKNKQSLWWRMSKRWTKHQVQSDSDYKRRKEHASNVHNIRDLEKCQIPKGMRRRLEPVSIPDLGITYRLPLQRKTVNEEIDLLSGSSERHRAICNIIFNRFLSDCDSKTNRK